MTKLGFQPLKHAESGTIGNENGTKGITVAYVDDIFVITKSELAVNNVKKGLQEAFKPTELVPDSSLLWVKIVRVDNNFFLSKESYIENLLQMFSMYIKRAHSDQYQSGWL